MLTIKQVRSEAKANIDAIDEEIKELKLRLAQLRQAKVLIRQDTKAKIEQIKAEREAKATLKACAKVENKAKREANDEAKAQKYAAWLREYMAKRRPMLAIAAE